MALRRCVVCGYDNEEYDYHFYRVIFNKEVKSLDPYKEYGKLEAGHYNSSHLCWGCLKELFSEYPETIDQIHRLIFLEATTK